MTKSLTDKAPDPRQTADPASPALRTLLKPPLNQLNRFRGLDKPCIRIIIPAWNDAAVIGRTLTALAGELAHAPHASVAIVAGGEDDTLAEANRWAKDFAGRGHMGRIDVLPQPAGGKNRAINVALHRAADIVVLLDADTVVSPGWLLALIEPLASNLADVTTARFRPIRDTPVSRIYLVQQWFAQAIAHEHNLFGGGSIALGPQALACLNRKMPEDVVVGVDFDLQRRLSRSGLRLMWVRDAEVTTELPATWHEYWVNEVRWLRAHRSVRVHTDGQPWMERMRYALSVTAVRFVAGLGWMAAGLLAPISLPIAVALSAVWAGAVLVSSWSWCRRWWAVSQLLGHEEAGSLATFWSGYWISLAAYFAALATARQLSHRFKGPRTVVPPS